MQETPEPRAFTPQEMRAKLARQWVGQALHWMRGDQAGGHRKTTSEQLEGAGHSMFATLDGSTLDVCGMIMAPRSSLPEGRQGLEAGLAGAMAAWAEDPCSNGWPWSHADAIDGFEPADDGEGHHGLDRFFARVKALQWGWAKLEAEGQATRDQAGAGFAMGVAGVLEGQAAGYAGAVLLPTPHEEDEKFHRARGQNWWPRPEAGCPEAEADAGGEMARLWVQRWGDGQEKAQALKAWMEARELAAGVGQAPRAKAGPRV